MSQGRRVRTGRGLLTRCCARPGVRTLGGWLRLLSTGPPRCGAGHGLPGSACKELPDPETQPPAPEWLIGPGWQTRRAGRFERFFERFDLGAAREVRIRPYKVGAGQSAQVIALTIEVWRDNSPEPEVVEVDYGDEGPTLAAVQAVMVALNRRLQARRAGGP